MNQITDAPFATAAQPGTAVVGRDHAHESAHLHVAGTATYVDDLPELAGTLHAALGLSPVAHGRLKGIRLDALRALPGVGDWTAQLIAMRVLAWPDAWPAADSGLLKALGTRDPKAATARAEAWRPWRAYAVMRLWQHLETPT